MRAPECQIQGVPTPNSSAIRRRDNAADGVSPPHRGVLGFFNSLLDFQVPHEFLDTVQEVFRVFFLSESSDDVVAIVLQHVTHP